MTFTGSFDVYDDSSFGGGFYHGSTDYDLATTEDQQSDLVGVDLRTAPIDELLDMFGLAFQSIRSKATRDQIRQALGNNNDHRDNVRWVDQDGEVVQRDFAEALATVASRQKWPDAQLEAQLRNEQRNALAKIVCSSREGAPFILKRLVADDRLAREGIADFIGQLAALKPCGGLAHISTAVSR